MIGKMEAKKALATIYLHSSHTTTNLRADNIHHRLEKCLFYNGKWRYLCLHCGMMCRFDYGTFGEEWISISKI